MGRARQLWRDRRRACKRGYGMCCRLMKTSLPHVRINEKPAVTCRMAASRLSTRGFRCSAAAATRNDIVRIRQLFHGGWLGISS